MIMKLFASRQQATFAQEHVRTRTTAVAEVREWAGNAVGTPKMLKKVQDTLQSYDLDPVLTEDEVQLAAPAIHQSSANASALLIALGSLVTAYISVLISLWTWNSLKICVAILSTVVLTGIFGSVVVWCIRTLNCAGSPAGVAAVVEDRRKRGSLCRYSHALNE